MRLVILLLAFAAVLSFTAARLQADQLVQPQPATAERRGAGLQIVKDGGAGKPRTPNGSAQPVIAAPPLFRPAVAPMKAAAPPKPGENYVLIGIAKRGERQFGMLRDTADGRTWSATVHATVGPWTVMAIDGRCVKLRQAKQSKSVCSM